MNPGYLRSLKARIEAVNPETHWISDALLSETLIELLDQVIQIEERPVGPTT